jgi:hypothetical protein
MGITLCYSGYYTHFSFVLFIISLILPFTNPIKFVLLLNSIIVGIVGNLIAMKDYDTFYQIYHAQYPDWTPSDIAYALNLGNFLFHTVPMFISLFLLAYCTTVIRSKKDVVRYFLFVFGLFLLWSLLPNRNKIGADKVNESYPSTNYLMFTTIVVCLLFFFILYFIGKK